VPFLFPLHPSPSDYWRFSREALEKECSVAGLHVTTLESLGGGVFSARYLALDRLMPRTVQFVCYYTGRYCVQALDTLFTATARALGKKYNPADYALGYAIVAKKS
jgi:hypothetical protein